MVQKNYLCLRIALDRAGKRMLGFTIGDRSEATAEQLLENIRKIKVGTYYTDYRKAYEGILPAKRPVQSKTETYSKSKEMTEYSLNLLFNKLSIEN